jgi:hypothetical protein
MNIENHCGDSSCICTHTSGCEKGWILGKYLDEKNVEYEAVSPCPICDPDRYEIFLTSKSRQELFDKLRARGTHVKRQVYEDNENSKTRTL